MQNTIAAFAAQTGADRGSAEAFLAASGFQLERALVVWANNWAFRADAAAWYGARPPFPFARFAAPLFADTLAIAKALDGAPVLVARLRHWPHDWALANIDGLRDVQWMLFWLLGHAAKNVPAIQAAGVTLVVDDADQSPVPVSQVLVILLEFIVNVLPVRISKVLVVSKHVPRFPWFQKAVAAVSPNPGLLRRFGIDIVHVNRQTLLDYVDEVNLPVELGGKLDYNHSEWFKDLAPVFANLTYAAPQLPPSKHHPEVTINKAIAAEENDPSILTEFLADSWSTANHTLRRIQTASATVAAATTSASTLGSNIPQNSSAEATAAYIAILEDYRDRHNRHFATFKRPMDEKEALTAHSDALNDAKSRFGQEKNGLELLESIENDLNTMENDASQTFSERLRNSLMQQVMEAKRRWEFLISSRTLTTEDELNAQVTDVLAEIKPENAPKGLWESVVTAMDEYVRKPLLPVIEDEAAKDKVKGKERLGA